MSSELSNLALGGAFTTVATRRDLGPSGASTTYAPPSPKPKKPTHFPDGVREYVQRCFANENALRGITHDELQERLKAVINDAAARGVIDSIDWATKPLPHELILRERHAAIAIPYPNTGANVLAGRTQSFPANTVNPNKRKSSDMLDEVVFEPPWRKVKAAGSENRLELQASAPPKPASGSSEKKQRKSKNGINANVSKSGVKELEKRRQRFGVDAAGDLSPNGSLREDSPAAMQGPVVGTCEILEKRYFRLTSAPKPETVRPLRVLEKTLDLLKEKWKTEYNYSYICDQFKSMRQDLTVQHIKNAFTVNVYETHAHIALQRGDLGEYNQCQTQLRALYKQGLGGRPAEFLAYRILYFIYTGNRTDMSDLLASISPADRKIPAVKHALDVRSALALGNYHRFFQLYLEAPNMGPYLMDMFLVRERLSAMTNISKAYAMSSTFLNQPSVADELADINLTCHLRSSKKSLLLKTRTSVLDS